MKVIETALFKKDLEFCGTGKHKLTPEKFFQSESIVFPDVRNQLEVDSLSFNFKQFEIVILTIPVDEHPDRINELPKDNLIVCFCSSGIRSGWANIYLFPKRYNTKWLDAHNEDLAAMLKSGQVLKASKSA